MIHKGRGAGLNTPNPFERLHVEMDDVDEFDVDPLKTEYFLDSSETILSKNSSPDLYFDYSLNPYRGCEHGCIYCYARPSHEYLGFSAGLDFESKIMVKQNAPELLRKTFSKPKWSGNVVLLSGNTDPYQPIEKKLQLSRQCIQVFCDFRSPLAIVTKNNLVTRDIDLLAEMAEQNLVSVTISITSLEDSLIGAMEPRTSRPALRLKTVRALADAGIPVGVNIAPVIPGLTDEEIPRIMKASAEAGASFMNYLVLRLPGSVEPLFLEWLTRTHESRAKKVINRIREVRDGKLTDAQFGSRFRGKGLWAKVLKDMFDMELKIHKLRNSPPALSSAHFRVPGGSSQTDLFST